MLISVQTARFVSCEWGARSGGILIVKSGSMVKTEERSARRRPVSLRDYTPNADCSAETRFVCCEWGARSGGILIVMASSMG